MKFNELKDKWLNYLIARGRAEGTGNTYGLTVTKFIGYLATIGVTDISFVTTQMIEDYLFGLDVSTNTKAQRMIHVKRFFDFLYTKEYINTNPTTKLESIKISQKRPEYLSQEQYITFIDTIKRVATPYYKERDLTLVQLLAKTGLRRAEIVGLNVDDVDLSKLRLRVKRKGNREEYLIIHHELAENLSRYLRLIKRNAGEPLFMSKKGQRLSASSVWHLIKTYSKEAGFNGDVTVHSMRHTFASNLLFQRVPLSYIQKLMGHKSPQTTARYLHIQDTELTDAFNRVTFGERG